MDTQLYSQLFGPIDYSRLSSYFRELEETSKPVIRSSTLPAEFRGAFGPWVSITAAVAKASFALGGVEAAGRVVDLALALSGADDAQTELLKSIKADTLLLRQEPLRTAITLMGEAERVGPGDERWVQFLERAVDSLYRAKSLAASSEELSVVHFGLACAYLTSGKSTDAGHWIEESVESEREVLEVFVRNERVIIDVRGGTVPYPEWTDIVARLETMVTTRAWRNQMRIMQINRLQKHAENFARFLHFANSVEVCAATIFGRSEAKVLGLDPRGVTYDGKYRLYEGTVTLPARKSPDT